GLALRVGGLALGMGRVALGAWGKGVRRGGGRLRHGDSSSGRSMIAIVGIRAAPVADPAEDHPRITRSRRRAGSDVAAEGASALRRVPPVPPAVHARWGRIGAWSSRR